MAKVNREWISSEVCVRDCVKYKGFDFDTYLEHRNEALQQDIKDAAVKEILARVEEDWEKADTGYALGDIIDGVYAIKLSAPFGIVYDYDSEEGDKEIKVTSPVIYIGKGAIRSRLKQHLEKRLFDLSVSLHGVGFEFLMLDVEDGRSPERAAHVESNLLSWFDDFYGGKPLLNKNSGKTQRIEHKISSKLLNPLKANKQCIWGIRPEKASSYYDLWTV